MPSAALDRAGWVVLPASCKQELSARMGMIAVDGDRVVFGPQKNIAEIQSHVCTADQAFDTVLPESPEIEITGFPLRFD